MPYGDRSGPDGMGQRTGRGLGYCSGYDTPGFTKGVPMGRGRGLGRGFGRGLGRGFGRRTGRGFAPVAPAEPVWEPVPVAKNQEKQMLQEEMKYLEQEISEIKKRLNELK